MAQRDPKCPATQDVVHAPHIGQSEVPTIGDVPVEVEIKRPNSHADYGRCQPVDRLTPGSTKQQKQKTKPEIHRYTDGEETAHFKGR